MYQQRLGWCLLELLSLLLLPILPILLLLLQVVVGIVWFGPVFVFAFGLGLWLWLGLTFGKYVWTRGAEGPWLADSLLVGRD